MEVDERTEIDPAWYFDPDRPIPNLGIVRKLWYPVVLSGIGVGFVCFANAARRRPVFSGIQQHAIGATLGMIFGSAVDKYVGRKAAHRDLVLYNYIASHPEDFPPIERKKFADIFQEWIPVR